MELNVVQPEEIDLFFQSIRKFQVADVGSKSWIEAHERMLKLNQQAVVEASGSREEVVKELLVIQDKLPVLVHEVYCILVWRTKVLPKLLLNEKITTTLLMYTVLYHESAVISLLETILYHESSCESLGDVVIDLIDYCVHGVTQLIGLCHSGYHQSKVDPKANPEPAEELEGQKSEILFNVGMKCVTILSYLVDRISTLSVSAARRVTQTHDVPCLLSELLALRPWLRRIKNFEKFVDGKWTPVEGEDILKIVKVEAQTWFCLRSLMFHRETFECYEINSFRQRELGKCSGLLNEVILDQLPPLADLKQFLCSLQLSSSTPSGLTNLVLEVIPEVSSRRSFMISIKTFLIPLASRADKRQFNGKGKKSGLEHHH
jgi:zinc finger MYND domain-containing protein 10